MSRRKGEEGVDQREERKGKTEMREKGGSNLPTPRWGLRKELLDGEVIRSFRRIWTRGKSMAKRITMITNWRTPLIQYIYEGNPIIDKRNWIGNCRKENFR